MLFDWLVRLFIRDGTPTRAWWVTCVVILLVELFFGYAAVHFILKYW